MFRRSTFVAHPAASTLLAVASFLACDGTPAEPSATDARLLRAAPSPVEYEVWTADQSNSVAGETQRGVNGSWIWVWDGNDVEDQVAGQGPAAPLPCAGMGAAQGPCDANEVFPAGLAEFDADGLPTGALRPQIGRLHGLVIDPQNKYITANFFNPGGGFVGILDGRTKEAIALFRISRTTTGRSNHMSFWTQDGSAIIISNLDGKLLERIDVVRNGAGDITDLVYAEGAGLGIGRGMSILERPKVYLGTNLAGSPLIGSIAPGAPDLGELTPTGHCRENGCGAGPDASAGGRPNNLIICPIPSQTSDHTFVTLGGGGLLVVDHGTTPIAIVGEYGNQVVNGAGCGGIEADGKMFVNSGVAASPPGLTQSTFTVYSIPLTFPDAPGFNAENTPAPVSVIRDAGNTASNGALVGPASNTTGQLPGTTTRRDSHGMARTLDEAYLHIADRIRNVVEVVRITPDKHLKTYDLVSANGKGSGVGPCAAASITDDPLLPTNDPAPDLMDVDPNGDYLFVAFRGPVPVSSPHAAQGSCPGVGVVELSGGGNKGRLVGVLRTTNTVDTVEAGGAVVPGGHTYVGAERTDPHSTAVRRKVESP